jgi:integrase
MATQVHLTKRTIENSKYEGMQGGAHVLWDKDFPGFGLRVFPSGKKSFVLFYRNKESRKKHLFTLGRFGVMTLDQGRKAAIEKLSEINQGLDPAEIKRRTFKGETFAELCQLYIERHAKVQKRTWKEDQRRIAKNLLPVWGQAKIKFFDATMVRELHRELGLRAPYEANRCLALISAIFSFAIREEMFPKGWENPAKRIKKFPESARSRWLSQDEVPKILISINQEQNVYIRAAFLTYLLTGLRKSEVLGAKYEDIDFNQGRLRLPHTKSKQVQYLDLPTKALAIIKELPREFGNPYIFPGNRSERPLVNVAIPWRRICKRAGVENCRIHDLRRTVGSWLAQSGVPILVIKNLLRQKDIKTTTIYAHLADSQPKIALEQHSKRIAGYLAKENMK